MEKRGKVRCQRLRCDAFFSEDDNPEGSCRYHDGAPIFHDGMKEWSCCNQRSHDFSLFVEIPGCMVGKHTTQKPDFVKPISAPKPPVLVTSNSSLKESCPRCRQGFFCSDHGSQVKSMSGNAPCVGSPVGGNTEVQEGSSPPPTKKIVDINMPQICKNIGCGKTFKEKDNHDTACSYHPGPPVFHDRLRGWKCCDIHVKEFDEFMAVPPCAKGWHNGYPMS